MTEKNCEACGRKTSFGDDVEGVPRTICCAACCRAFVTVGRHLYAGSHRLTEGLCLREYGCTQQQLASLAHVDLFYGTKDKVRRFYLGAEVQCLSKRRDAAGQKRVLKKTLDYAQHRIGQKFRDLEPLLKAAVLQDYVKQTGAAKPVPGDLAQRRRILARAQRIRAQCPEAHPQAVVDFCLAYPSAGPKKFCALREKVQKVLFLEGDRIIRLLSNADREVLRQTPLRDALERFETRDKKAAIRVQLERKVRPETAQEIVEHGPCQLRIEWSGNDVLTAEKLLEFWNGVNDVQTRACKLAQLTDGRRTVYSGKAYAPIVGMYVQGFVDVDVQEVAGIIRIAAALDDEPDDGHKPERISVAVARMEQRLREGTNDFEAEVADAVAFAKKVPLPASVRVVDSFDFKFWTTGYWNEQWSWVWL